MSLSLTSLLARLRTLLPDPQAEIWADAQLEECLRLALADVQSACPAVLTISGLDGALASNLDDEIKLSLLVLQFARQHARAQRLAARSELYHPDPQQITPLAQEELSPAQLQAVLEKVRLYFLQRSARLPY
jgi:hypothetical protein